MDSRQSKNDASIVRHIAENQCQTARFRYFYKISIGSVFVRADCTVGANSIEAYAPNLKTKNVA